MSTARATVWSVTINNPNEGDDECIALARQKGWKVDGQTERGANGTPHYQLLVATPQVRFSAVKKAFPRAHIEVARNRVALGKYVHKEDTRESELPTTDDQYPSMSRFWDLIAQMLKDEWWAELAWEVEDELPDDNRWYSLVKFDWMCNHLIRRGYFVETMAVNPQVRSAWRTFGRSLVYRSIRRQTDRQTDGENVSPKEHTQCSSVVSTVVVPVVESGREVDS